jgi:TFIIF-interacting CTD phosphatase-like protein
VENASFIISVVIEGIVHNVYVMKRPGGSHVLVR